MTTRRRQVLRSLRESIKENTPRIERRIAKSGIKADPAVVSSAAKYYKTLEKLAKE